MSKVFNMVGGGGKNISSIIITGLESTDTITCTKDGKSYIATWDDTDQHWEIVGLPLGTFTVTATNGTKTKTETVLIDITGVYEIDMSFKLWLYREGDECEDITGGWNIEQAYTTTSSKQSNHVKFVYANSTSYGIAGKMTTVNTIDVTDYATLHIVGTIGSSNTSTIFRARMSSLSIKNSEHSAEDRHEFVIDISEFTGSHTVQVLTDSDANVGAFSQYVYAIWLE